MAQKYLGPFKRLNVAVSLRQACTARVRNHNDRQTPASLDFDGQVALLLIADAVSDNGPIEPTGF
jgi:hypothetical protein